MIGFLYNAAVTFGLVVLIHRNIALWAGMFGILLGFSLAFDLVGWFIKRDPRFKDIVKK